MLSQNPAETYQYYDLPFCRPKGDKLKHKRAGLGEVVDGNRLVGISMQHAAARHSALTVHVMAHAL